MSLKLTSGAFNQGGSIPDQFSKKDGNASPPLEWHGLPPGTKSLALIVDDPDAPSGTFVHWLLYDIPISLSELKEGVLAQSHLPGGLRQGRNGFGEIGYGGPQPPSGTHRYFFRLYALDTELDLAPGATREQLEQSMRGHILEQTELMGRFESRSSRAA